MNYTTILVTKQTREKLSDLKQYRRETYDEIIHKLLDLVPEGDDEGRFTPEFRAGLIRARSDIRHGRLTSLSNAKKRLGL